MVKVIITRKDWKWYKERKTGLSVESERIAKAGVKILKETIKNYVHVSSTYPTAADVMF